MSNTIIINDIKPFNSYIAVDGETDFTFDWFVFKPEYVKVYKNEGLLTYISDYTIQSTSIGNPNGGRIILNTPCEEGDEIVIFRKSDVKRTSGYTENGDFRANAVNLDFGYLISLIQEINFQIGRSIVLTPTDSNTSPENLYLPKLSERIGKFLGFDNNGNFTALESTNIDLYYNWVRITENVLLEKKIKKAFIKISGSISVKLPVMSSIDDGREILLLNLDSSTANATIEANSTVVTIDGDPIVILEPKTYKKFVYNHSELKWFTID
jgi:hypothetical protein